jgi:hypothetical protein
MSAKSRGPGSDSRAPTATTAAASRSRSLSTLQDPYDCWLCGEPVSDFSACDRCRRDLGAQLRRRRDTAPRLPPLEHSGARDPLERKPA